MPIDKKLKKWYNKGTVKDRKQSPTLKNLISTYALNRRKKAYYGYKDYKGSELHIYP